ncbi:homeobox protein Hox-C6b-like [Battus philenor]|uniref:homeobox protein Hox-C6b-like n=1 Tax=Battus philenor TaxID=42288 RepID=UPI0035D04B63
MESAKYSDSRNYTPIQNTNMQSNWQPGYYSHQQVQHCNSAEYWMSSYPSAPIVANNNTAYEHQWNQSGRGMENKSCFDILKDIKRHRAQFRRQQLEQGVTKRKRRTVFNTEQILTLEKIFNRTPYINRQERIVLQERLNISERVIKVWFQNRRRTSIYKEKGTTVSTDSSEEDIEGKFDLEHVESLMRKPDKSGYVTLDEKAINQLMTAIDSVMPDINLNELCTNSNDEPYNNSLNYDPISPVSNHNAEDEVICLPKREAYEPEESLRRLFDIQSMIMK